MARFAPSSLITFVLASASPARRRLLESAGLSPMVHVSQVDEDLLAGSLGAVSPRELCRALALAKARDVAASLGQPGHPDRLRCLVLGCDSVLDLDGVALGKPRDSEDVRQRWALMSGRSGLLLTGHALVDLDPDGSVRAEVSEVAATVVRFGRPSRAEIDAYISDGEPFHVAGAFTIDGRAGAFVEGIDGDHGTVIGVSLPLVRRMVNKVDVTWTDLWTHP